MSRTVAIVTMGCARNEVDSEELAGRLAADGWTLVSDVEAAEVAVVNTCGFIESAKKDSIDALLEANSLKGHGKTRAVVAVGCMAERYGQELAKALPEADGILDCNQLSLEMHILRMYRAIVDLCCRSHLQIVQLLAKKRSMNRMHHHSVPVVRYFVSDLVTRLGHRSRSLLAVIVVAPSVLFLTFVAHLYLASQLKLLRKVNGLPKMELANSS
jgi:tRNA A37 methylthiotransferase MiaB